MSNYITNILDKMRTGNYKVTEVRPVVETDSYYRKIITENVITGKVDWYPLSQYEFREFRNRKLGIEKRL